MRGLLVLSGESFRSGQQHTRVRGRAESVPDQLKARDSHVQLIDTLKARDSSSSVDVALATYTTPYLDQLTQVYKPRILNVYDEAISQDAIFKSIMLSDRVSDYDWVFWTRVDIELSDTFMHDVFPTIVATAKALFVPFTLGSWWSRRRLPIAADTMLFIPKSHLWIVRHQKFVMGHHIWFSVDAITKGHSFQNIYVMLDTMHDSDSYKDWNPLYRIVNRPQAERWHSKRHMRFSKSWTLDQAMAFVPQHAGPSRDGSAIRVQEVQTMTPTNNIGPPAIALITFLVILLVVACITITTVVLVRR